MAAEDGHFHIKSMEQSQREQEVVDVIQEERLKNKGRQLVSPQRRVKVAEEESALDHFEYLESEHFEEASSVAAFRYCLSLVYRI